LKTLVTTTPAFASFAADSDFDLSTGFNGI
jgi:hypothetical protein